MPEVEHKDSFGFSLAPAPVQPEKPKPSFLLETIPAAFRMENDVLNAIDYIQGQQKSYAPTPGFDPGARLREIDTAERSFLWDLHGKSFVGVRSEEEFQAKLAKIRKEDSDRDITDRSGFGGAVAAMVAGTLSPTVFLPFIGSARGARAAATGAGWGFAGGLAQEVPLQMNQETRTAGESAVSVAASTVISGMLGGAIGVLRPTERQVLEQRLLREMDMVLSRGEEAIPNPLAPIRVQPPATTYEELLPQFQAQVKAANTQEKFVAKPGETADYFEADANGMRRGSVGVEVKLETVETPGGRYTEPVTETRVTREVVREGIPDFQTGKPVVADVFHGTATTYGEYDPSKLGSTTQAKSAQEGFFFSRDPRTANRYTELSSEAREREGAAPEPQVRMERVRMNNPFVQDFEGGRRTRTYAEIIADAKAAGHDGVIFKNTRDGGPTDDIFVVFSPDQIAPRAAPRPETNIAAFDVASIGKNFNTNQIAKAMNDNMTAIPHSANDDVPVVTPPKVPYNPPDTVVGGSSGGSVGSADPKNWAGGVAKGVPQWIIDTSPVLRTIQQKVLKSASWMMAQFADAGVMLEGNLKGMPSAVGGSLESLVKQYDAMWVKNHFNLENAYADYFFDGAATPAVAPNMQATIGGMVRKDKMTKVEFNSEVSTALWSKDTHPNPHVQKAAQNMRKDLLDPLLVQMKQVGLLGENLDLKGDLSYLLRDYDVQVIRGNTNEFIELIADNYEKKMLENFSERVQKLQAREGKTNTLIEDLERPVEEVEQMQGRFKSDLQAFEKGRLGFIKQAEETINDLRQQARAARRAGKNAEADKLLEEARQIEKDTGPMLEDTRQTRKEIKERLRNLNKSRVVMEKKQAAKLALVERLEELNINSLDTAITRGRKILDNLDNTTDEVFMKEVRKFMDRFASVGEQYDETLDRIAKISTEETGGDLNKLLTLGERQDKLGVKLSDISAQLDEAEQLADAVPVFREILQAQLDAMVEKVNRVNSGRAVRSARLLEQAKNLDPATVTKRIEDLKMSSRARREEFLDKYRQAGADDIDIIKGTADFKAFAREIAVEIKDKIIGTYTGMPAVDIMRAERGAELARAINIDSRVIAKFLRTDASELSRKLTKTVGPDIEIMRRFQTLDFEELIRPIADETNNRLAQFDALVKRAQKELKTGQTDRVKGEPPKPLSAAERKRLEDFVSEQNIVSTQTTINNTFFDAKRDLRAVFDRLRGEWGIPDDPEAMGYRLGKLALNLNVLRFMGGTALSSLGDAGRAVMKHGLSRVFGDGFNLLIGDLKAFKMSAKEVQLTGAALDVTTHSRSRLLSDVMTDYATTTKFERGVDFLTGKMGIIALFDYWTSGMKQFTGVVANARFLDSVETLMAKSASPEELQEATTFLASHNIGRVEAEKIWKEMQGGGATRVRGTWLPNTEDWKDPDITRIFRAAVLKNVNDTIIEPGVELPIVMNKTIGNRMLFQFKSFGMSSTYKTVAAGLQQRDIALVQGMMVSLAFGALSYYTYAMAAGGKTEETMRNAGPEKWADEAIQRSGILGIIGDGQRIAERLPFVGQYATLSGVFGDGERLQRNAANGLVETLLGPTFGLAKTLSEAVVGIENPTQSTAQKIRTLAPFQNIFYLRRIFDAMVSSLGLPERRDQ